MMRTAMNRSGSRGGFTLVELLVVIAIIALLLGILLPALSSVTGGSKKARALAQLNSLAAASQGYYADFKAYPGYFSEVQMQNTSSPGLNLAETKITSNENLVLSLLGQVVTSSTQPTPKAEYFTVTTGTKGKYIATKKIGAGPRLDSGRVKDAYYAPAAGELKDATGGAVGGISTNGVKDLIDPHSGMPVLYYRAQSAGSTLVAERMSSGRFGWTANKHYVTGTALSTDGGKTKVDQKNTSLLSNTVSGSNYLNNLAWCLVSQSLSNLPSDSSTHNASDADKANNADDVPAGQIAFISAGADRVYLKKGAHSEISMLKEVRSQDDVIVVTGN